MGHPFFTFSFIILFSCILQNFLYLFNCFKVNLNIFKRTLLYSRSTGQRLCQAACYIASPQNNSSVKIYKLISLHRLVRWASFGTIKKLEGVASFLKQKNLCSYWEHVKKLRKCSYVILKDGRFPSVKMTCIIKSVSLHSLVYLS